MNYNFKCDYYRMTGEKYSFSIKSLINILFKNNLKLIFLIRLTANKTTIFSKFLKCYIYLFKRKYGIDMHPDTRIGEGLALSHAYNITINPEAIIGKNVNLTKGVTIGREPRGSRMGSPIIGNCVYIGINSTIVGNIKIGNNVLIAPNSFVNKDIPDNSIVLGNPCKIIPNKNATESYVYFFV